MEDDLNGRRPQWKTTLMEDDFKGRQPHWKTTIMEDDIKGPKWKTTSVEVSVRTLHLTNDHDRPDLEQIKLQERLFLDFVSSLTDLHAF